MRVNFSFKFVDDKGNPSYSHQKVANIDASNKVTTNATWHNIAKTDFEKYICPDGSLRIFWQV